MVAPKTDFPRQTTAMVQAGELQVVLPHLHHEGR